MRECFLCSTTQNLHRHHIFGGSNRKWSEKYDLVVDLCQEHHTGSQGVHFNKVFMDKLHIYGQELFERNYPDLDFRKLFGWNYL